MTDKLIIRDRELEEEVALVESDGGWEATSELAEAVLEEILGDDGVVGYRVAVNTADGAVPIEPGEDGYLFAVADALPSPLEGETDSDLKEPDVDFEAPGIEEKLRAVWSELPARIKQKLS